MILLHDLKGEEMKLKGFKGLRLQVPAPSFDYETENIEGAGTILIDKTLQPRHLVADFNAKGYDYIDSLLLRDEVHRLFAGKPFYISESLLPWKRWLVNLESSFDPDRMNTSMVNYSIPLVAYSGCSESVATMATPLNDLAEGWQDGLGLIDDDETLYEWNVNAFKIWNAGDVTIDQRQHPLKITFKGASNGLEIVNNTTDEAWKYEGTTTALDEIIIEGNGTTKNGISIFSETNKKLFTLQHGWNYFSIRGNTGALKTTIESKFYYY